MGDRGEPGRARARQILRAGYHALRRYFRRPYRLLRRHLKWRYLIPLKRYVRMLRHPYRGNRRRAIHGTSLGADVRALRARREGSPRVALRNYGLRAGARRMHVERFTPEVRNANLNAVYERALGR